MAKEKAAPKAKAAKPAKAEPKAKETKAKGKAKAEPPAKAEKETKKENRFAVIQAQGLQLRVAKAEEHILPHMGGEPGAEVKIERVLLVSDDDGVQVGTPIIEGASVLLQVVGHEKGDKVKVGTYKRRKKYRRKIGYRDTLTRVKILDITLPKGEKRGKHGA